jgi:hypothetical protein
MPRRLQDGLGDQTPYNVQEGWDPNDLLHPAQAFEHPSHVVHDADLTLNEKRAILASWGIRRLRAGGEPAFALRPGRQATGTVRRCNGGSANAGQRGQRKGQRALSASIAPRPPRTTSTSLFNGETLDQLRYHICLEKLRREEHVA